MYGDAVILMQGRKPGTKCGGHPVQGVWGQKSPSGDQRRSPGRRSGGQSPPEAEAILDFYMHNFDLILNYFCFARATEYICTKRIARVVNAPQLQLLVNEINTI